MKALKWVRMNWNIIQMMKREIKKTKGELSLGKRRFSIFRSKKGKNYKEESKEETQDTQNEKEIYETKVEKNL